MALGFRPRNVRKRFRPKRTIKYIYGFSFQKLRFFQRKVLRTLLTGRSNYKARLCLAEFSPLFSTTFDKKISPTSGLYFLLMAGTTRLELATSCVTGMRSNQLSYAPKFGFQHYQYNMLKKKMQEFY